MPVTLVTDPADVDQDPDVFPWVRRLKYARVEELLNDYRASNAILGRQHCPVSDYFAAHLDDDILEVEAHCYSHVDWGPWVLCESLYRTLLFNHGASGPHGEFQARWVQHYLALNLVRYHSYEAARPAVEAMLKHHEARFVSGPAAWVILGYFNQGHPNPRRFMEKHNVARLFPGIETYRFRAPDFD